jgi:hypothetical protein
MKPRHKRTRLKFRGWGRLIISLALGFSLLFAGGGITKAEDNVPMGIMDGVMSELAEEVRYVKGDAMNWTKCDISFAVMSLTAGTAEAVFEADLAPGESIHFKLKPGDYVMLAIYMKDGVLDGTIERAFRIVDSLNPFGFDFRPGVPPVKA